MTDASEIDSELRKALADRDAQRARKARLEASTDAARASHERALRELDEKFKVQDIEAAKELLRRMDEQAESVLQSEREKFDSI